MLIRINYQNSRHTHRPMFYLKHVVSETGFSLRLQVSRIQRQRLALPIRLK
jgi:hypothetical protein